MMKSVFRKMAPLLKIMVVVGAGLGITALSGNAKAEVVGGLYSASVPVADQSEKLRGQAIKEGLGDVFVRLTGSRAVLADSSVRAVLGRAQEYVVEYSYADRAADPSLSSSSTVPSTLKLEVSFSAQPLERMLRQLSLPIWPADRPALMIWLVTRTANGYQFVEPFDKSVLPVGVENALKRRGVPFKVPLYDLQDQMSLTAQQAGEAVEEKLAEATRRYGIDSWLVLLVAETQNSQYQGAWFLGGDTELLRGSVSAGSLQQLIDDSVDPAIDQFSRALTYQAGQLGDEIHLLISNVDSYADFSAVTTILSAHEVVVSTQVTQVVKDLLYLDVVTEGDPQVLVRALDNNSRFARVAAVGSSAEIGSGEPPVFQFEWRVGAW